MKKRLFCLLLTLCMCVSFPLVSAAQGEPATGGNLQDDLSALGTLVETNSPAGAVGIAYNISSGTTRYYGISGNILANADISEPLTVPGWFPEAETSVIGGGDSVNGIIGSDDRTKVTDTTVMPYSAILYLLIYCPSQDKSYPATAFMISPNVALTAAHCLYHTCESGAHEWSTLVAALPGLNGEGNGPFGFAMASEIVVPVQYYETQNPYYDWGVIRFTSNIGNKTGYFGYQFVPHSMVDMNVTITGYPAQSGDESKWYSQWTQSGDIIIYDPNAGFDYDYVIDYLIDTQSGQSGSPVYRYFDGAWTVVGIHTREWYTGDDNSPVYHFNQGVRFTSQMFSFVFAYRNL